MSQRLYFWVLAHGCFKHNSANAEFQCLFLHLLNYAHLAQKTHLAFVQGVQGGEIMNYELFDYGINKSFKALFEVTESYRGNNQIDINEMDYHLGNCLLWAIAKYERIGEEHTFSDEDKSYLSGFRFAYNELKHGKKLTKLANEFEKGGDSNLGFPLISSVESPIISWAKCYLWASIELSENKHESQYRNFNEHLKGKMVITTVKEAIKKINQLH